MNCFVEHLFTSRFETEISEKMQQYSRIWLTHEDAVLAISTKRKSSFLNTLPLEIDNRKHLQFLDVPLVVTNNLGKKSIIQRCNSNNPNHYRT